MIHLFTCILLQCCSALFCFLFTLVYASVLVAFAFRVIFVFFSCFFLFAIRCTFFVYFDDSLGRHLQFIAEHKFYPAFFVSCPYADVAASNASIHTHTHNVFAGYIVATPPQYWCINHFTQPP